MSRKRGRGQRRRLSSYRSRLRRRHSDGVRWPAWQRFVNWCGDIHNWFVRSLRLHKSLVIL